MTFTEAIYDAALWFGLPIVGTIWATGLYAAIHTVPWQRMRA